MKLEVCYAVYVRDSCIAEALQHSLSFCVQETAQAFICFLVEYFETAKEAEPVSKDPAVMHRLKYNANNKKVSTMAGLVQRHEC